MPSKSQIAASIAAITDPIDTYRELVEYNGTVQNMALRRMTREQLVALRDFAATQPKLPFSTCNLIEQMASIHLRRLEA